jgi:hypothetical protein
MAATKTPEAKMATAKRIRDVADWDGKMEMGVIALDSEYVTGGEAITFVGFRSVVGCWIQPRGGYVMDYTDGKVKVYVSAVSDAVMVEVASSTDLSALSDIPYIAFGY